MSPAQSKRMVVLTMFGTGTLIIVSRAREGNWPEPRMFLGLAVVYVILGFVSDVAPKLAGPFSLLVFLAVLLSIGVDAFGGTATAVNRNPDLPSKPGRPGRGQPSYRVVEGRKR